MVRDKNLSVISSLSILENTQQNSLGSEGFAQHSPSPPSELAPSLPPHSSQPPEVGGKGDASSLDIDSPPLVHEQTTPTTSHTSIHMTLEDHQRQLKTLQDEVLSVPNNAHQYRGNPNPTFTTQSGYKAQRVPAISVTFECAYCTPDLVPMLVAAPSLNSPAQICTRFPPKSVLCR